MARIELVKVRLAHAPKAVRETAPPLLDFVFEDGGAYALLGASGSGKTALLNLISGLEAPSEGQVMFGIEDVTRVPAERRNVAHVLGAPVVYEAMTVRDNLAFPLRNRGAKRKEALARADEVAGLMGLMEKVRWRGRRLGLDDRQRVALGRGLVRQQINAMLLDEPLGAIHPDARWELRARLAEIQGRLGWTTIYATSTPSDALTFAQKVAVLFEGEIVQVGSAQELMDRPQHTFVGAYVGSPGMNLVPVMLDGQTARLGEYPIALPGRPKAYLAQKTELGVRPEYVRLGGVGIPALIERVDDIGRSKIVRLKAVGRDLIAVLREGEPVPSEPFVSFDPKGINLYGDGWRIDLGGAA